jgi:hypothetical protein
METEAIAFGIDRERHEAVRSKRCFLSMDAAAGFFDTAELDRAVLAAEIDERSTAARFDAVHSNECAWRAGFFIVAWKCGDSNVASFVASTVS